LEHSRQGLRHVFIFWKNALNSEPEPHDIAGLLDREQRFRALIENSWDAIVLLDAEANICYSSPATVRLLGYTPEEFVGHNAFEWMHPDDIERTQAVFAQLVSVPGSRLVTDHRYFHRDGSWRWLETSGTNLLHEPSLHAVVINFRDVTAQKATEHEQARLLRELETERARLEAVIEYLPVGVVIAEAPSGRILMGNVRVEQMLRHPVFRSPDVERYGHWRGRHADGRPVKPHEWPLARAARHGEVVEGEEFLYDREDGTTAQLRVSAAPIRNAAGEILAGVVLLDDVSDRREIEQILRRQLQLTEAITQGLASGLYVVDAESRLTFLNPAGERLLGWSEADLKGKDMHAAVHFQRPDGAPYPRKECPLVRVIRSGGTLSQHEEVFTRRDGSMFPAICSSAPLVEDGETVGAVVSFEDISRRKQQELNHQFLAEAGKVLATSLDYETTLRELARLAVPHIADWCAVDLLDEAGNLRRVSVQHVDPEKVALAHEVQRRYPSPPDAPRGLSKVIRTGESEYLPEIPPEMLRQAAYDADHLRILESLGLRSAIVVPLLVRGRTTGALTLVAAESLRRFEPEDLELAQELAERAAMAVENARLYRQLENETRAKDQFLAMLGHELRNPLAAVSNALQVMTLAAPGSPGFGRAVEVALRQIQHQKRLVDDLLDVSRVQRGKISLRKEPLDLCRVVRETLEDHRPTLEAAGLSVRLELPEEPVCINGDRTRMAQILGNLLDNARKFVPEGGAVTVSLRRAGGQACLEVADTGTGIRAEMLPRIFDAFMQADVSLDRPSGGLGLGLALVRGLTELHGGTIRAESPGPGQGSRFSLTFPLTSDATEPASGTAATGADGRRLRVLVVEDITDAAETMRDLLGLLGFEVEVALSGPEGVEAARRTCPDVVLCDIGLPGMSGYEVAAQLRREKDIPPPRLIALTGYGGEEDRRRAREAGFDLHLTKPVEVDQLREALEEMGQVLRLDRHR
jgi:PAS domain S-box-containing protein